MNLDDRSPSAGTDSPGKGPVAYRFGKHLKSAVSDVRAWVAEQREAQNRR